jgi:hypothetical protein
MNNYLIYFLDFKKNSITQQFKTIYDNINEGLRTENKDLTYRYFHSNILNFEEVCNKNGTSFIKPFFENKTSNWTVVQARTLYSYNFLSALNENFAQITVKYIEHTSTGEIERYIVFERALSDNISFHSWRVFVVDYGI